MKMMKACCSEVNLNLESLFNCNFLNDIFFSYFIYNFGKKLICKQRKTKEILSTFFYIIKSLELLIFCVKTDKSTILLHFMEVLYQKD